MGLVNNVNGQANQPIRVNNLHCPGEIGGINWYKCTKIGKLQYNQIVNRKSSHTLKILLII